MNPRAREIILPALLLCACFGAFFLFVVPSTLVDQGHPSLFTSYDFASYFLPRYWLGSEELAAGRLPLWQPYEFAGLPLLATAQPAVLYPPKVLFFGLFDAVPAHWAFLVFHFALATASCFWFLERSGFRGPALFAGTALWIFSTMILSGFYVPIRIACLAWLPVLLGLALRIQSGGGLLPLAALALVVAIQLGGGYPEVTLDSSLLIATAATAHWFVTRRGRPPWRAIPLLAAAVFLGAAAAALQLLPLAELGMVARRASVATERVTPALHFPAQASPANPFVAALEGVTPPMFMVPGLFALFPVGLLERRGRTAAATAVFCTAMFFVGWRLIRFIPGFGMVRVSFTWLALALFCCAWVGAYGARALFDPAPATRRVRGVGLWLLVIMNLWLVTVWLTAYRESARPGFFAIFFAANVGGPGRLVFAVGALLSTCVFAALGLRGKLLRPELWEIPFVATTLAWLTAYPFGNRPASFAQPFPAGEVASMHGHPRAITGRALAPTDLLYGYEITDRIPSALGVEESLCPWRWRRIVEHFDFIPLWHRVFWDRLLVPMGFWNALDTELFVAETQHSALFESRGLRPKKHLAGKTLFENPGRMGHAWVNHAVHRVRSDREAFDYVMSDRFDPGREVVLEGATDARYPEPEERDVTVPRSERRQSPTELEVEVDLARPGVLVVSESAYPGWTATVDGAERRWVTADYVLRGVELGPGSHRVRFEYRPASVRWGKALSIFGLAAIAGLFLVGWRRPRLFTATG